MPRSDLSPQSPPPTPPLTINDHQTTENLQVMQPAYAHAPQFPVSPPSLVPSAAPSRSTSVHDRRSSVSSIQTRHSQPSPVVSSMELNDESREKGRCPYPDCGRVFRDLKSHMYTHLDERPEKCPIVTCVYHIKGFARKYDKNRHTLTHYKGTMVCDFCPGSGSPAEKSFNRADVFKRHLTGFHKVEQTPPNCRKRTTGELVNKKVSAAATVAAGKCSTCSSTFSSVQDFYEHLDECVLRVVQREEPSEAINRIRLAEIANDEEVGKTMEKHMLVAAGGSVEPQFDDNIHDNQDDDDNDSSTPTLYDSSSSSASSSSSSYSSSQKCRPGRIPPRSSKSSSSRAAAGITKIRPSATATSLPRRSNRDNYPPTWTCSSKANTRKRVVSVFDGHHRLWKDEMRLRNDLEVRIKLPHEAADGVDREAYVTDLDIETMRRAGNVLLDC